MIVTTIKFPVPAKTINLNDSMHWTQRRQLVEAWRDAAFYATRDLLNKRVIKAHQPFSTVGISIPVRSLKIRRDPHNWTSTLKAVIDGLVLAALFKDDSSEYLTTTEPTFHIRPYDVIVTIKQIEKP